MTDPSYTTVDTPRGRWRTCAAGAACGALAWGIFAWTQPFLPDAVRVVFTLAVIVFGPGAALTWTLLQRADGIDRWIVPFGFGLGAAPAIVQVLGLADLEATFPYLAAALAGAALAAHASRRASPSAAHRPAVAFTAVLIATALALGAIAYGGRLDSDVRGVTVFGDYDSFDSTYYAAISGELTDTIPPRAPFQSGHSLNYSYFPHLLVAIVHRCSGVALLDLYFIYIWPLLLALAALTGFVLVRRLDHARGALYAMMLLLTGSDLSFLVPLVTDTSRLNWDPVIWSTNFFSPGAETLLFNTWTPTLAILFTGLYAFSRYCAGDARGWCAITCACFAWLVAFKTFGFAATVAGLVLTTLFAGGGTVRQWRSAAVLGGTLAFAVPYLADVVLGYEDSQAYLTSRLFVIPARLVQRLRLDELLEPVATFAGMSGTAQHVLHLFAAVLVLFVAGLGFRLAGVPALWRAIRRPASVDAGWTLIAWTAVCGALIPFAIATEPYHGTLHFYQTTLFLMPLFVGPAVARVAGGAAARHWVAVALVFACAVPSTAHYLARKRSDRERPLASLDRGGVLIADYLGGVDRDAVILHRAPAEPSLIAVLSRRRTVLAWSRYVRNSGERQRDVEQFFSSAGGDADRAKATLQKYSVTHVVVMRPADAVHGAVLRRLTLVMETPQVALYAVP